jgi:hypothetical protein
MFAFDFSHGFTVYLETFLYYVYDKNILILPPGAVINARTMQIKMFLDIQ